MKKQLLLLTLSAALLATAATTIFLTSSISKLDAGDNLIGHTITFTSGDVSSKHSDGDDMMYFDLWKDNATLNGDGFGTSIENEDNNEVSYVLGSNLTVGEDNHIFVIDYNGYYIDAGFYIQFDFKNVAEYNSITLLGEFHTNKYLTNPQTELVFDSGWMDDSTYLSSFSEYYKIVVDEIVISYKCA